MVCPEHGGACDTGDLQFLGPFTTHSVVLYGREVPFLEATPLPEDRVLLMVDHKCAIELTRREAEDVVPFLADCIAVALGYTAHPAADAEPNRRHPFPAVYRILREGSSAEG